ncbi:MAG: response regulator [Candidatus Nanopelagicales bacterium]|jgi:DNA-binding response OmpR family regulator
MARTRVLVADTDMLGADALAVSLRLAGYDTLTAFDVHSAVDDVRAWRPDVIVLDPRLPGGDAVAEVRRADPAVAIVAALARSDARLRVAALVAGADAALDKPFTLDEAAAVIDALQRGNRRRHHPVAG